MEDIHMFHLRLSITGDRSVFAYSIVFVFILGWILVMIPCSWGVPVFDMDERMEVKPPPPTLKELSDSLRRGQYTEVLRSGRALLAKDSKATVYGMFGVALAGLEQFDNASKAIERAKATNEPNHRLFAHISQAMTYQSQKQYDDAISECRTAIKLDPKHPLAYTTLGMAYFGKQDQEQAEKHLKKAVEVEPELAYGHTALGASYLVQKKVREAFASYRRAAEIDPKDSRPHVGLATIYTGMRMFHHAINEYETVLRLNPSADQVHLRLSALYLQVGKYDDAITEAKAILLKDSQSAEAHLTLGRAYSFNNQFDSAIEHLKQLIILQPESVEGHYLLGLSLITKGDLRTAQQTFQKAEGLAAQRVDIPIAMGIISHLEENFQSASAQFKHALEIGSGTTDRLVNFLIANMYLSQKEWTKAEEHLQQANGFIQRFSAKNLNVEKLFKRAASASFAQTNLATLYLTKGWQDKGLEACNLALKRHKSNPIALYIMGKGLIRKREIDQAIAQFQQAIKLEPEFAAAHYELAELHIAKNSLQQAISEYQKVLELNPRDVSVHLRLGAVYELDGKNKEAVSEYSRVIALAPDSPLGYNQLAYHYAEKGSNWDDALTLAQQAVKLAPRNGAIRDTLGWVYFKQGEYTKSLEELKLAVQAIPYSPAIRYHLGMVYFKSGDNQNALNEFRNALRISQQFTEADEAKTMIQTIEA